MGLFDLRYEFDWSIPFRGPYLQLIISGIELTFLIAIVTTVTSLCIGTLLAVMRLSRFKILSISGRVYVEVVRNIPGLFWLLFFYFVFPQLLPFSIGERLNSYSYYPIIAGIFGLTFDNSAYVSDIIRTGIMAVPEGNIEAAVSTALNRLQQIRYIILPIAFRIVLPPLVTRMIHNFKNTSLCMAITVPELTWATQQIESLTFRGLEVTLIATAFYISVSLSISALIKFIRYLRINNVCNGSNGDLNW